MVLTTVFLTTFLMQAAAPPTATPAKPAPSAAKPAAAAAKPATAAAKPAAAAPKPAAAKPAPAPAPPAVQRPDGVYATFNIVQGAQPMGAVVIRLFEKEQPLTVANFIGLARGTKAWQDPKTRQLVKRPLYNGLTFHRVIPGFMIQGGDPLGTGMGGTEAIKDEFSPDLRFNKTGLLAMANAGPNTGSSQFFITDRPSVPHLDGKHPIFGEVIEGQDLVEKIARVERDDSDKPRVPVIMKTVTIDRFPKVAPAKPAAPKPAAAKPAPAKPAAAPAAAPAAKKAATPPPAK
jgi:peptidyl-prolyl cis-trans isomerase A (cyclophilin A)